MKNVLLLSILTFLIACNNQSELNYYEKRMVGNWIYTDVDYRPNWGFKEDVTGDYFGVELILNNDKSLQINNLVNNTVETGVWQVNMINASNIDGNGSIVCQLVISYEQANSGQIVQEVWDNINVTRNKVVGYRQEKDASYCYEIKRK